MKRIAKTLSLPLAALVVAPVALAVEGLDEMTARKARHASVTWGPTVLEAPSSGGYLWQPETLCFSESLYGNEVWRLTSTPSRENYWWDITYPNFSADGKRIAFVTNRDTAAFNRSTYHLWMTMRTDGSNLRPMPGSVARTFAHSPVKHWDPSIPDVLYDFGRTYGGRSGTTDRNVLYRTTVADKSETSTPIITLPDPGQEIQLVKSLSSDGTKAMALTFSKTKAWPLTLSPTPRADVPAGYSVDRPSIDHYWGQDGAKLGDWITLTGLHDQYATGPGGNFWFLFMPTANNGVEGKWWRMRLTGGDADGGPLHRLDRDYPYDWGNEVEPANTSGYGSSAILDPWKKAKAEGHPVEDPGYLSHPAWDRWGRYVAYASSLYAEHSTWDFATKRYASHVAPYWPLHTDWHAFSDNVAASTYNNSARTPAYQRIVTWRYDDPTSFRELAHTHVRENVPSGTNEYQTLARPGQSPDGTKIVYHSSMLNNANTSLNQEYYADMYYVVASYPHPPEITQATGAGGAVRVRVDWRLATTPRGYTLRGWPVEGVNLPPPPREVAQFRLWRSADGVNWFPLSTTDHDIFTRFDFVGGTFRAGMNSYWELQDNPKPGTWFYGVTSVEHSGLESRTLSNVLRVVVDASGEVSSTSVHAAYPADPGGKAAFYTLKPPAPKNLTATRNASVASQYRLSWVEPPAQYKTIRYYNVYYSTTGVPDAIQQNRIASLPRGTSTYLDWNADPARTGYYRITSVDTQGNEGTDPAPEPPSQVEATIIN